MRTEFLFLGEILPSPYVNLVHAGEAKASSFNLFTSTVLDFYFDIVITNDGQICVNLYFGLIVANPFLCFVTPWVNCAC